jgi:hypothetical protein
LKSVANGARAWKTAPAPWTTWGAGWLLNRLGDLLAAFGLMVMELAAGWLLKRHEDPKRTFWTYAEIALVVVGVAFALALCGRR